MGREWSGFTRRQHLEAGKQRLVSGQRLGCATCVFQGLPPWRKDAALVRKGVLVDLMLFIPFLEA